MIGWSPQMSGHHQSTSHTGFSLETPFEPMMPHPEAATQLLFSPTSFTEKGQAQKLPATPEQFKVALSKVASTNTRVRQDLELAAREPSKLTAKTA